MRPGTAWPKGGRRPAMVLAGSLLSAALLAGGLAGCSTPAPELDQDTAVQLQAKVLAVTRAAGADDPATSLRLLDELATQLDQAAARGAVSFQRHQSVRTSIDAVRADLTAQQAAVIAAKAAAEQQAAAEAAAAQAAAAAAAAAQAPAVVAPPAVAPAPGNADKGDKPKKSKGNG